MRCQCRLLALDITTGANKPNSPALVAASVTFPGRQLYPGRLLFWEDSACGLVRPCPGDCLQVSPLERAPPHPYSHLGSCVDAGLIKRVLALAQASRPLCSTRLRSCSARRLSSPTAPCSSPTGPIATASSTTPGRASPVIAPHAPCQAGHILQCPLPPSMRSLAP